MKTIQLTFSLSGDNLGLKSIIWNTNTTDLPSDSSTLEALAITILKSIRLNSDDLVIQDLLNELNIKRS